MGSLIEELRRGEAAARAEVDLLSGRLEELEWDLARAEEQVLRQVIAGRKSCGCWRTPRNCPAGRPASPGRSLVRALRSGW
ncbi:MAG TPA: hypothetical protein VFE59_29615 [Trebonia sp.]|nr:hypothetical protein [Trebonia sp.]